MQQEHQVLWRLARVGPYRRGKDKRTLHDEVELEKDIGLTGVEADESVRAKDDGY